MKFLVFDFFYLIDITGQLDLFAEALLLKVPNGELIGEGKKVQDIVLDVIVFEHVHEMSTVAFDLLLRRHSAEHDFGETLACKHTEADSTDWSAVFDQSKSFVFSAR